MAYEIYLGCEQLGGTDWGDYDIEETIKLSQEAIKLGFHGFDVADCYSLGLAEERLSQVFEKAGNGISFITKGGIRWKKNNSRAITWKDSRPEYLQTAVKNSLKRLKIDRIPIYLLHWHDLNVDIFESLNLLNNLKTRGYIEKIGIANPSLDWLSNTKILSLIDHLQVNDNILKPFPFPRSFNANKIKYNIKVSSYGILSHGLLTTKYNKKYSFPKNDRRHRLYDFNDKKFILKRNILFQQSVSQGKSIEELSILYSVRNASIDILIIGCKTRNQAISNINNFQKSINV